VYCRSCDYNLTGVRAGRCPECATAFDPADPASYEALPRRRVRQQQIAAGIGSAVAIGVVIWLGFLTDLSPVLLLIVFAVGAPGLAAIVGGIRLRKSGSSMTMAVLVVLPALIMLGLFYSLAIHMHQSLGGWPKSIGMRGFSSGLERHAHVAFGSFGLLLLTSLLAAPVCALLCVFSRRSRAGLLFSGIYALSFVVAFGAMMLAPSPFLAWWWD
jgi:hypothetical protein